MNENPVEKAVIGVYVGKLNRYVPFAYWLFCEEDAQRDLVVLGQRKEPSRLLRLSDLVGDAADNLIFTLHALAKEHNCATNQCVKELFTGALMPGASAFNLDDGITAQSSSVQALITSTRREISNEIRRAETQLQLIDDIDAKWLQETYEPEYQSASAR